MDARVSGNGSDTWMRVYSILLQVPVNYLFRCIQDEDM